MEGRFAFPADELRTAEQVTRLLPDGRLEVIPDVGHTINYSAPQPFVELIRRFLDV